MNKDEQYVLECLDSLAKAGLPLVPLSIAIRSGMPIDKCSRLLESLRFKHYINDV